MALLTIESVKTPELKESMQELTELRLKVAAIKRTIRRLEAKEILNQPDAEYFLYLAGTRQPYTVNILDVTEFVILTNHGTFNRDAIQLRRVK